jgi:ribonuclease P protein component
MEYHSLKNKKDFESVLKYGRNAKEDFLVLKFVPNNLTKNRFGIIISNKVSKKATLRNKIRRRIKAIILKKLLMIKKYFDIVILTRPGIQNKNFKEIEKTIEKVFTKAKIID